MTTISRATLRESIMNTGFARETANISGPLRAACWNSRNEVHLLLANLKRTQANLAAAVLAVRQGMDQIAIGSAEIAAGNTDLSSRTEQQAASLQQTAASMEELASTVK